MAEPLTFDVLANDRATGPLNKVSFAVKQASVAYAQAQVNVEKAARRVTAAEKRYGKESLEARDASAKLAVAQTRAAAAAKKLENAENGVTRHTKRFGNVVSAMVGNLASRGVFALQSLGASAIRTGLETASGMQQAEIAFSQLLGSTEKAKAYIEDLTTFAAATPFEFPGLVDASRLLLGVGVASKDVIPTLTDFGDAAGALAINQASFQRIMLATSQSIAAGRWQVGDLNQLMNNGLPIWNLLSKAMHKPVPEIRELASHGKLLSKDVLPLLRSQMHKDYGGAMQKQSQTLSGLWSTMQDTFAQGMAKVLMPLVPLMQAALPGAMEALGKGLDGLSVGLSAIIGGFQGTAPSAAGFSGTLVKVGEGLRALSDTVGGLVSAALPVLSAAWGGVSVAVQKYLAVMNPVRQFMSRQPTLIGATAIAIGTMVVAWKAWTLATKAWAAITKAAAAAQLALNIAMSMNPIGLVVIAIAGLVAGLIYAYKHSERFRAIVQTVGAALKTGLTVAVKGAVAAWNWLVNAFQAGMAFFRNFPSRVGAAIKALPSVVGNILKRMVKGALFLVGYWIGTQVKLFEQLPRLALKAIIKLPGLILRVIHRMTSWAHAALRRLIPLAFRVWVQLQVGMARLTVKIVNAVVRYLGTLPGKAYNAVKSAPRRIKSAFSSAGRWLLSAGRAIINGLINGIKGQVSAAVQAARSAVSSVISGAKSALGISSPSRVAERELGAHILPGMAVGVERSVGVVRGRIGASVARALPSASRLRSVGPGRGEPVQLEIVSGGSSLDDLLVEILRRSIRIRGGNVQVALGLG